MSIMKRFARGALTLNAATVIRALRHGPTDAGKRARAAFYAVDPFGCGVVGKVDLAESAGEAYLSRLPELSLRETIKHSRNICVDPLYDYRDGSLPWCDIRALLAIAVDRSPAAVLEIGTFNGYTTRQLALNLPRATIHTLDLPPEFTADADGAGIPKDDFHLIQGRDVGVAFRNEPGLSNIRQHFGDTVSWNFELANDASLFFIDGSHTYAYVRNDTEKVLKMRAGRPFTIIWHDCDVSHEGVTKYLVELLDGGKPVRRISGTNLAIVDEAV